MLNLGPLVVAMLASCSLAASSLAQGDGIFTFGEQGTPSTPVSTFSYNNVGQAFDPSTFTLANGQGFGFFGQPSQTLTSEPGRPHIVYQLTPAALDGRIRVRVNPSRAATPPQVYLCTRLDGAAQTTYGVQWDPDALTTGGLAVLDRFNNSYNAALVFTNNPTPLGTADAAYWLELVSSADALYAYVLDDNGTTVLATLAGSLQRSQTTRPGYGLLIRGENECCGASSGFVATVDDLSFMSLSRGSDANNDGKPDLYWRDASSGNVYQWLLNGTTITTFRWSQNLPGAQWRLVGAGNVDNQGASDLIWQDDITGAIFSWALQTDGSLASWAYVGGPGTAWRASAVADFNHDSFSDIAFRNTTTGENAIWFLRGGAITGFELLPTVADQRYSIIGACDMNYDGQNDLLWNFAFLRNDPVTPDTDLVSTWLLSRTRTINQFRYLGAKDAQWTYLGAGDFDADRSDNDLMWHNTSTGDIGMWRTSNANVTGWQPLLNIGTSTPWRGGN
jgi:hypothetical protein